MNKKNLLLLIFTITASHAQLLKVGQDAEKNPLITFDNHKISFLPAPISANDYVIDIDKLRNEQSKVEPNEDNLTTRAFGVFITLKMEGKTRIHLIPPYNSYLDHHKEKRSIPPRWPTPNMIHPAPIRHDNPVYGLDSNGHFTMTIETTYTYPDPYPEVGYYEALNLCFLAALRAVLDITHGVEIVIQTNPSIKLPLSEESRRAELINLISRIKNGAYNYIINDHERSIEYNYEPILGANSNPEDLPQFLKLIIRQYENIGLKHTFLLSLQKLRAEYPKVSLEKLMIYKLAQPHEVNVLPREAMKPLINPDFFNSLTKEQKIKFLDYRVKGYSLKATETLLKK